MSETRSNDRPSSPAGHRRVEPPGMQPAAFFGQILVEEAVLGRDELRDLIRNERALPPEERASVGHLAVRMGHLSESRLLSLLDRHGHRLHIGELLVLRRLLRPIDLHRAIRERKRHELVGETLLRLGLIDPWALAEALAEQAGIACIPIHHIPVSPDLASIVGAAFCVTRGVVPVACRDRCLILAIWRPQDLSATQEIEQVTHLQVLPVLTTRREIEERIRILYLEGEEEQFQAA